MKPEMNTSPQVDEAKMHDMAIKMVTELGAAAMGSLVITGEKLGLYRELAAGGPTDAAGLAERCGCNERYVREWLSANAASGYIDYDGDSEVFSMNPEQQWIFSNPDSPFLMTGGFLSIRSLYVDEPRLTDAFRSGDGVGWGDHDSCLFCGVAKFFKPSYQTYLVQDWLPALEGRVEKLERGAKVADVGCGHGLSTMIMAESYPQSQFTGYDIHEPSLVEARQLAKERGLTNVSFEVSTAKDLPANDWDLVTFFDCLHDMGDPAGAAARAREAMAEDGSMMVVEPMSQDSLADNLNPISRVYYAFSTTVCTPCSLSQEVGAALGAQAGQSRLEEVITGEAGFSTLRRATETPFNMVLEARN
jgi:2-polyprenyl-3-methyl-5-hydroxy-6-metoxy-1,4-benzoquinol methylase